MKVTTRLIVGIITGSTVTCALLPISPFYLVSERWTPYLKQGRPYLLAPVFVSSSRGQEDTINVAPNGTLHRTSSSPPSTTAVKRKSGYRKSAYYLSRDEDRLQHNFISFIDHSVGSPYSQVARLVEPRVYARPDQFQRNNTYVLPTIDDVAPPASLYGPWASALAWNGLLARGIVGTLAYLCFPVLISFLQIVTKNMDNDALVSLVNTFLPGVAIVLGTYFSLTLSILYNRFSQIQQTVTSEASLLALCCRNLLDMLCSNDIRKDCDKTAVQAAQCIADQVRTLVRDSRGRETMMVIYSDPYTRLLQIVAECRNEGIKLDEALVANVRSNVADLCKLRAHRISYEGLALAPTHFDVMTFLCGLLLTGYALGTLATACPNDGTPAGLAQVLFSALVVCYVLFYEMCYDLNRPFDGIYQLRRSGAAMHLLQVKLMIVNHPVVGDGRVDFEVLEDEDDSDFQREYDERFCARRKAKIWYN